MSEENAANKKFRKELKSGTVSLALLGILNRSSVPLYGYEIAKKFDSGLTGASGTGQGALYPVLRSLEKSGLLSSRVEPSVSGPPRRYYQITGAGRETLGDWTGTWIETRDFVDSILKGKDDV
ncbi:MAG: PadR family transcriptional regulator [Candidatus Krumholzibacteriota bacterium]|nr:PadR family transcriptional regulator [Candidatus Krumholzibacteriota bacterium]